MEYYKILQKAIKRSNLSLNQICTLLTKFGLKTNKSHLSKLQNGKLPPASDKLNDALAHILNIDPIELKAAAYREKIPPEVLKVLQQEKRMQSA